MGVMPPCLHSPRSVEERRWPIHVEPSRRPGQIFKVTFFYKFEPEALRRGWSIRGWNLDLPSEVVILRNLAAGHMRVFRCSDNDSIRRFWHNRVNLWLVERYIGALRSGCLGYWVWLSCVQFYSPYGQTPFCTYVVKHRCHTTQHRGSDKTKDPDILVRFDISDFLRCKKW